MGGVLSRQDEQHKPDSNGSTRVSSGRHKITLLTPVPKYYNPFYDPACPLQGGKNQTNKPSAPKKGGMART